MSSLTGPPEAIADGQAQRSVVKYSIVAREASARQDFGPCYFYSMQSGDALVALQLQTGSIDNINRRYAGSYYILLSNTERNACALTHIPYLILPIWERDHTKVEFNFG